MNYSIVYEKGWICPKCGKVWAPSMKECPDCNRPKTSIRITTFPPESPITWLECYCNGHQTT